VNDKQDYGRTPLWGWVIIIVAAAMFVGLVLKTLNTGPGR